MDIVTFIVKRKDTNGLASNCWFHSTSVQASGTTTSASFNVDTELELYESSCEEIIMIGRARITSQARL